MRYIKRKDIMRNKDMLFVFGDNDKRMGFGGAAKEFRGEKNTYGIRVKYEPKLTLESYYKDSDYKNCIIKIKEDTDQIRLLSKKYLAVYIIDGIGEGLSKLYLKAPEVYRFLQQEITKLKTELYKK